MPGDWSVPVLDSVIVCPTVSWGTVGVLGWQSSFWWWGADDWSGNSSWTLSAFASLSNLVYKTNKYEMKQINASTSTIADKS